MVRERRHQPSSASARNSGGEIPLFPMDEENLSRQIESSKADVSEISEALENFDIDLALHEQFNQLEERLRSLEIKFQALIKLRRN